MEERNWCLQFSRLIRNAVMNLLFSKILKLTLTFMAASSQKVQEMLCRPGKLERDQFKYPLIRTA